MSQSGSQAAAFFREVAEHREVWFVRDDEGPRLVGREFTVAEVLNRLYHAPGEGPYAGEER